MGNDANEAILPAPSSLCMNTSSKSICLFWGQLWQVGFWVDFGWLVGWFLDGSTHSHILDFVPAKHTSTKPIPRLSFSLSVLFSGSVALFSVERKTEEGAENTVGSHPSSVFAVPLLSP